MKLLTKLTLFITLSKLAIVVLFVILLPTLVDGIAFQYTNHYLEEQKKKVLHVIEKNGIDVYLQGEENYGSYTMLKEEYIALEPLSERVRIDTIETSRRIVEADTLTYRVLSHSFINGNKPYLLEIGKTTATISQYNRSLQRVALYVLSGLILLTVIADLVFTRYLLRPLGIIIRTRLKHRRFPFIEQPPPVRSSTEDFRYLDQSLIQLMEQVNEAFQKEREFTSNASHELLTPISILQSKLENTMIGNDLDENLRQRLMEMMKTLSRLKKIVHSLLFISRIENEQFERSGVVLPSSLLESVTEELQPRMEDKGLQLHIKLDKQVKLSNLNQDLLFQLFYNLVTNAIRYNRPNGSISITDELLVDNRYCIHVSDTGVGMTEEEQLHIFNRFKKSGHAGTESVGLGLAIVKTISRYLSIAIDVQSAPGKGSTFSVIFPASIIFR